MAAACLALGSPAHAATFILGFTGTGGAATNSATLTVTTEDVANAFGSFNVLGITGLVGSDVITGIINVVGQPTPTITPDGLFIVDNVLTPTSPFVTNPGLYFGSASAQYNLFSSSNGYELYKAVTGSYVSSSVGTLTATAVPEPATWLTLLLGFSLVGWTLRKSKPRYGRVSFS